MSLTLKTAIDATQTTIDVDGSDALSNGDLYTIEDEQVYIVTASAGDTQPGQTAWQRLNVQRGQLGTTEVAHDAGTAVTLVETPLGSGAVEQIVYSSTTTLTDAQIKALPTTGGGIQLVPAPGAGLAIMPLFALLLLDTTANYYDNIAATATLSVDRMNSLSESFMGAGAPGSVSGFLQAGAPYYTVLLPIQLQPVVNTDQMYGSSGSSDDLQDAIKIRATNGAAGNLTQGHASNVMTVTVHYTIVSI